ncbi:25695_t:CDS:2 [Dentiscutata erythropus]|uniref:25695_t:CDS:1 n=1 Tax=Dentiscutata erythropus TaxID=1348616 RepID=A0A9N9IHL1_9GLOM|nr:25695_t:CDS:2 [Dentiscutata erythropus]
MIIIIIFKDTLDSFPKGVILLEFWTRSEDSAKDQAMLKQLYEYGNLRTIPENYEDSEDQFWNAF